MDKATPLPRTWTTISSEDDLTALLSDAPEATNRHKVRELPPDSKGRTPDDPDYNPFDTPGSKLAAESKAKAATEERAKRWAPHTFAVASLPRDQPWAAKLRRKFACSDPVKFPPTLIFTGDAAVSVGATDDELGALPKLTPKGIAELNLRQAAELEAQRIRVREMARSIAVGNDDHDDGPLYADVGQLLDNGVPDPPKPDILRRSDGVGLFYRGEINLLYGDPEDGKTMIALAACAEVLADGGTVLFVDLDDNGVTSTVSRLLMLGAPEAALRKGRFRYCSPAGRDRLTEAIKDNTADGQVPDLAVIDCVGELVPLFDGSNNDSDDFTRIIRSTAGPLARAGAGVVLIDHMAKNSDSRRYGAGGTMAKRRRVGGTQLRVVVEAPLCKGQGGSLRLLIRKDRHSGLRQHCYPAPDTEGALQEAGRFILDSGDVAWCVAVDPMVVSAAVGSATRASKRNQYVDGARLLTDGWTVGDLARRVHGEEFTPAQRKATARAIEDMITAGLAEKLTENVRFKSAATHRLLVDQ